MFFKEWFKKKDDEVIPDVPKPPQKAPTSVMSEEQKEIALKWLEDKWPKSKRSCKVCGKRHHVLAKDTVTPNRYIEGFVTYGGDCYPSFMVICANCGETKFFNAVKANIIKSNVNSENLPDIY